MCIRPTKDQPFFVVFMRVQTAKGTCQIPYMEHVFSIKSLNINTLLCPGGEYIDRFIRFTMKCNINVSI